MNELTKKVIKGLECCLNTGGFEKCKENCPYFSKEFGISVCSENMLRDALTLLKAQEPILLENQHKPYGHFTNTNSPWISRCPKCGKKIEGKQTRFCKYCGQAVKWDE